MLLFVKIEKLSVATLKMAINGNFKNEDNLSKVAYWKYLENTFYYYIK